MYANLTSALTMTTDMPANDANTLEQSVLALERSALELDEQRDLERKQRDSELDDIRKLLVATLEQNTGLVDLIARLAGEVLDRPADSVTCPAIAKRTELQCRCKPMQNGYCCHHQDQVPKNE